MQTIYPYIFVLILIVAIILNFVITKFLNKRRNSQFRELAQKLNLQVSCEPKMVEGQGVLPLGFKIGNVKFLEKRKIYGEINGKSIVVQDSIGRDGSIVNSFFNPEYGGKTRHRITTLYVNNEIVSNKTSIWGVKLYVYF